MLRAEMPFEAEILDRGIAPPVLLVSGRTVNDQGGATILVVLEIGGLPARQLEDLQDAILRRLSFGGMGAVSLVPLADARGRPLLSLTSVEVPAAERQSEEVRVRNCATRRGRSYRYPASEHPGWPGGPTGQELRRAREGRHMCYTDLAAVLAVDGNKVMNWERGIQQVPASLRPLLRKTLGLGAPAAARYTAPT